MSGFSQTLRSIRSIWNNGDDEFDDEDDYDAEDTTESNRQQSQDAPTSNTSSTQSRATEAPRTSDRASFSHSGGNGGGSGSGVDNVKRLRPVSPALRAREKNIYALRPRSQEEAVAAADALKTGDAVIINLEEVARPEAIRIIDFMSGVCYGLEYQGHAMKLGELIFLYTPGDFEISSDESDYGENVDPFFMDEGDKLAALSRVAINNPRVISVVNMPADVATSTQSSPAASQTASQTAPNVVAQMAQMQAQAAQAVNAQAATELTAAQAQVVPDPQLQAQRDAIRAAQNARAQSLPGEPLSPLSSSQRAIPASIATPAVPPTETPSHLTAQGYISPSSPMPRAATSDNAAERVRRPWER